MWSLWSPCNTKCGLGQRERYRNNLIKSERTDSECDSRCYTQTINCTDNPPCENNMPMGKTISIYNANYMLLFHTIVCNKMSKL